MEHNQNNNPIINVISLSSEKHIPIQSIENIVPPKITTFEETTPKIEIQNQLIT